MEEGPGAGKHPQQLFFDNVSPATRLLEKRRQMYEVQDNLETQQARFAREEQEFAKKERMLREKDEKLQHQLFRFNRFLQDNEAKRRRAETRTAEEAAQIRQKDEEIADLERQLEESNKLCADLEEQVSKNMKYKDFLKHVKDTCDNDYSEISDLVTRYRTLEGANRDLMEIQTASENKIEQMRNHFQTYKKEQEMEMLAFTNKIAQLSTDRDEVLRLRQSLEHQLEEATHQNSKHSLSFGQILMSVENLLQRCTTQRESMKHFPNLEDDDENKGKEGEEDEPEDSFRKKFQAAKSQLKVILFYLKDFKDITTDLRKERRLIENRLKQEAMRSAQEHTITVESSEARADRPSQNSGNDLSKSRDAEGS